LDREREREREGEKIALKVVVCAYSIEERGFDVKKCVTYREIS
jgi:hypothetical protein